MTDFIPMFFFISENYEELYQWSVTKYDQFWSLWWDEGGFLYSKKPNMTVDMRCNIAERPTWFGGAELNFAENLLRFRDDRPAIIATSQ